MLIVHAPTANALAPHARERSWVMFLQANPPRNEPGLIKIEGIDGQKIASHIRALVAANAYELTLIGLIPTTAPHEHAHAIALQYGGTPIHHDWYEPTPVLLTYIQHMGQAALAELLAAAHPGGLSEAPVTIDEMAKRLGVSIITVRRMVTAGDIPYLRQGRILRFVPSDVIASLEHRRRA